MDKTCTENGPPILLGYRLDYDRIRVELYVFVDQISFIRKTRVAPPYEGSVVVACVFELASAW